jgi:hypothetical protein
MALLIFFFRHLEVIFVLPIGHVGMFWEPNLATRLKTTVDGPSAGNSVAVISIITIS